MTTLINNRGLCQKMGEAARIKAEREFGVGRLVSETLASYRKAGWKDRLGSVDSRRSYGNFDN
jgi:hypothetical protein